MRYETLKCVATHFLSGYIPPIKISFPDILTTLLGFFHQLLSSFLLEFPFPWKFSELSTVICHHDIEYSTSTKVRFTVFDYRSCCNDGLLSKNFNQNRQWCGSLLHGGENIHCYTVHGRSGIGYVIHGSYYRDCWYSLHVIYCPTMSFSSQLMLGQYSTSRALRRQHSPPWWLECIHCNISGRH